MTKSILGLSQVVSKTQTDSENIDPAQSDQINEKIVMHTTLKKLEAQLQKQELLNSHFASQISINSTQIQSSIQEFQHSLQLIFQELKDLKEAQSRTYTKEIPVENTQQVNGTQNLNSSSGILGSAPNSGNRSIPQAIVNKHAVDQNATRDFQHSFNQFPQNSQSTVHTSSSFLHHKSMKLEFPMYNGSGDILAWIKQTKLFFRYHKLPDCESEYKLFDLMLERNDKKIFDKNVFIFDPGGSIFDVDDVFEIRPTYGDAQIIILVAMLDIDNNLKVLLHTINASEKYAYVVHSNSCLVVVYKMLYKLQWPPSQNSSLIPHILFSNFQFHITLINVEADVGIFTNIFWRGSYSDILDSTIDLKWSVEIVELNTQLNKVYSLDWTPKNHILLRIVSAAQDGRLIAWNALASQETHAIELSYVWVMTCAFSPDGQFVACGGLDSACSIFNLNSQADRDGSTPASRTLTRHKSYVSSCQYIPDEGNKLITSLGDQTCGLWDVTTGQRISVYGGEFPSKHIADVLSVSINNSNANMFVSGSCDATARLWDAHAYHGHEGDVHTVKFFPYGQRFGTGSNDGTCRLFDMQTGHQLQIYSQQHGDNDNDAHITSITFSISEDSFFLDFPMVIVICGTIDGLGSSNPKLFLVFYDLKHAGCEKLRAEGSKLLTSTLWNLFHVCQESFCCKLKRLVKRNFLYMSEATAKICIDQSFCLEISHILPHIPY